MKSVKKIVVLANLIFLIGIASCVQKDQKPQVDLALDKSTVAELLNTSVYIPKRVVDDKTGQVLPYEPRVNPYTALKGRISSKYVGEFVAAKKAFQAGNLSQSQLLLETLTANNDKLSGPWVMLGDITVQQKKYDEAISNYAKAIEVNKVNINAYIKLAKIQRVSGAYIHAQNTYAKALSVWPDFPEAHLNLAILYDIYLNMPLAAQRHMESYHFLTNGRDKNRAQWLTELQQRTGKEIELEAEPIQAVSITSNSL